MERFPCCDAVASLVDGALASVIGVRVAAAVLALPVLLAATFLLRQRSNAGSRWVTRRTSMRLGPCEVM